MVGNRSKYDNSKYDNEGPTVLKTFALLCVLLGLTPSAFAQAGRPVTGPHDMTRYRGQTVAVKGVVSSDATWGNGERFVAMGGAYPDQVFTGFIAPKYLRAFSGVPPLEGRTVTIRGRVDFYKGKPEIKLVTPSQIEVE